MDEGLTYDQVMALWQDAPEADEGLTYEQVMALGRAEKPEPDSGYALSGLKGGVAKVKSALRDEAALSNFGLPGRLASAGLSTLAEKYADPIVEGWYARSASPVLVVGLPNVWLL